MGARYSSLVIFRYGLVIPGFGLVIPRYDLMMYRAIRGYRDRSVSVSNPSVRFGNPSVESMTSYPGIYFLLCDPRNDL